MGEIPGGIRLQHEFRMTIDSPWLEEQITILNRGSAILAIPYARCGFVLPMTLHDGAVTGPLQDFKATAVPYRREPNGNRAQYADYTLGQVLSEPREQSSAGRDSDRAFRKRCVDHGLRDRDYPDVLTLSTPPKDGFSPMGAAASC